ncbi:MAG: putative rane-anchored protein [Candidatus Saccharibacteria bacterium]|nr:putative rane-anchored protein [Candidatus Saccharibacteria bacterium]
MTISSYLRRPLLRKVPEVTIYFWIVKLLTTALGESTSDYLVQRLNPYVAVLVGLVCFAIAIAIQFRVRRYIAWVYWLAVSMVAVFGTMAADVLHNALGVPYIASVLFFGTALAVVFSVWYKTERTLSIHSINTPRRELFYWATVLTTFALGTAAGDLAAYSAGLGFLSAGILFAVIFAVPAVAWWRFRLHPIVAFWAAYIMTRPLGASFADWTGKSLRSGGLGWGDLPVSIVLVILIASIVGYLSLSRADAAKS